MEAFYAADCHRRHHAPNLARHLHETICQGQIQILKASSTNNREKRWLFEWVPELWLPFGMKAVRPRLCLYVHVCLWTFFYLRRGLSKLLCKESVLCNRLKEKKIRLHINNVFR